MAVEPTPGLPHVIEPETVSQFAPQNGAEPAAVGTALVPVEHCHGATAQALPRSSSVISERKKIPPAGAGRREFCSE